MGEPLAMLLRPGNAGSNTAADHITVTRAALAQLPGVDPVRPGRRVLVRTDGAGATHEFVNWVVRRRLSYSLGFTMPAGAEQLIAKVPASAWTPAYDAEGQIRPEAFVAELTGLLDLSCWPAGMRVIIRKERPNPGAQLRITDVEGNRITAFATNTRPGGAGSQLPDLELRHRRRARCEDRIRAAKDTGLANLPEVIFSPFADHAADLAICVVTGVVDAGGWGPRQHGPMSFDGRPLDVSRRWMVPRIAEVRCSPRAWASASRSSRLSCSRRRSRSVDASSRRSSEASEARCRLGGMRLDGCAW